MNFKGWKKVEEYNRTAEKPIFCATFISNQGLKIIDPARHETHRVLTPGGWTEFKFYTMDNTCPRAKRKHNTVESISITKENLYKALYVVNKSAKKSRDTALRKYHEKDYGQAGTAKRRKEKLYNLKEATLAKMIKDGVVVPVGYHIQKLTRDDGNEITNYLTLYKGETFTFHKPSNRAPKNLLYLGEIGTISAVMTRTVNMKFTVAVDLLKRYIGSPEIQNGENEYVA